MFEEIRPFVRHAAQINVVSGENDPPYMMSYDHLLLYALCGSGIVYVGSDKYAMTKGCILALKHEREYRLGFQGDNATYITVNFDYTMNDSVSKSFYIKPCEKSKFISRKVIGRIEFSSGTEFNDTVYLKNMQSLEEALLSIVSEHKRRERHAVLKNSAKMIQILTNVSRRIAKNGEAYLKRENVNEIIEYIHAHCSEDLSNKKVGELFGFHPQYINSLIKNKTGFSLHKYVTMRRISRAVNLLQNTNVRISEIADITGFHDVCRFSKSFKEIMGVSPREFRNRDKLVRED